MENTETELFFVIPPRPNDIDDGGLQSVSGDSGEGVPQFSPVAGSDDGGDHPGLIEDLRFDVVKSA